MKSKELISYRISHSKSGIPCLWERGGAGDITGVAMLIADYKGGPKNSIYIKRSGHLACGNHTLIPIRVGDIVVDVFRYAKFYTIKVYYIVDIDDENAVLEKCNHFENGEWAFPLQSHLEKVIEVAKDKSNDYHCRKPYYIKNKE